MRKAKQVKQLSENEIFVQIFKRIRSPRKAALTDEMKAVLNKYNLEYIKNGCYGGLRLNDQLKFTNLCSQTELTSMGSTEKDSKVDWVNKIKMLRKRNSLHCYLSMSIDKDLHIAKTYPVDDRHILTSSTGYDYGKKLNIKQCFSYQMNRRAYMNLYSFDTMRLIRNIVASKNKALNLIDTYKKTEDVKNRADFKNAVNAIKIYNNAIGDGFIVGEKKIAVENL